MKLYGENKWCTGDRLQHFLTKPEYVGHHQLTLKSPMQWGTKIDACMMRIMRMAQLLEKRVVMQFEWGW